MKIPLNQKFHLVLNLDNILNLFRIQKIMELAYILMGLYQYFIFHTMKESFYIQLKLLF
jgi:hypothetical protein